MKPLRLSPSITSKALCCLKHPIKFCTLPSYDFHSSTCLCTCTYASDNRSQNFFKSFCGSTIMACSVILLRLFETTWLKRRVCLISYSCTVKRFQSLRIDCRRWLKNSSNSSRRLSRMKIIWLRRLILCLRSDAHMDWLRIGSRSWISLSDVSISCFRLFWKSSWSREPRGTTG